MKLAHRLENVGNLLAVGDDGEGVACLDGRVARGNDDQTPAVDGCDDKLGLQLVSHLHDGRTYIGTERLDEEVVEQQLGVGESEHVAVHPLFDDVEDGFGCFCIGIDDVVDAQQAFLQSVGTGVDQGSNGGHGLDLWI